ncbi:MAG: uroporphyrinogen-III C-methyltransferase [Porticoccaceae bacterium]
MEKDKTPVPVPASAESGNNDDNDKGKPPAGTADPAATRTESATGAAATPGAGTAASNRSGAPQKAVRPRRRVWGKLLLLVIVVAAVAAGYYLWPRYGAQWLEGYFPAGGVTTDQTPQAPGDDGHSAPTSYSDSPYPDSPDAASPDTAQSVAGPEDAVLERALAAEAEERRQQVEQLQGQIADLHLQLNSQQDQLRRLSTTSREDWLLAEAEYLLRLASQRILSERQTANAVALMTSADAILRDFNDTELFPVRKALADDITRARMAEAVDREGIYLRLGALVTAVDRLHSLLPDPQAVALSDAEAVPEPATWQRRLLANARQALARLVGLVRIERRDLPLQPMLTLEQEQALRDNLRIVLEQARLALLREEPGIYRASLARAEYWVAGNFEQDHVAQLFRADLAELREQPVVSELPSPTASLRALQEYIRLWHNRYDDGPGEGADSPAAAEPLASSAGGEGGQP